MAFYLEKAIFVNRAPFEHIELEFKGKCVNVLSAVNGRGKTTILSHIVDAFYELARTNFENEFADKLTQYYRVSSSVFNINMGAPSFVYLRFIKDSEIWDYVDIRNKCTEYEYDAHITLNDKIPFIELSRKLNDSGNIKKWCRLAQKEQVVNLFNTNLLTYFPSYRYEEPGFLNSSYSFKIEHKIDTGFSGYLPNRIEVYCRFKELANWLIDVFLDNVQQIQKMNILSNKLRQYIHTENGKPIIENNPITGKLMQEIIEINNYPQQNIVSNINLIFSNALSSKFPQKSLALSVGERFMGGTRINVVDAINNSVVYPSIFNMSSGEKAIISLFVEIIHQMDNLHIQLSNITGVVLIDEIEKNLHIKMQYEVLPKLFELFPNIQFIISSHSPFLNMGLAEVAMDRTQIIDLDNNGMVCEPTNNDLYKDVYNMMVNENQRFYSIYQNLQNELINYTKPIVITEGKTDIIHILKAKEKLGVTTDFLTIQDNNQPDGDSDLQKLLEQLCKVKRSNKIIAIFDRDIQKTIQYMDDNGVGYKAFGNNVYGFCISAPQSRIEKGQNEISIEYLYSDDEIHTRLPNGCQLFFGDEFSEKTGRHINDKNLSLANQSERGKRKIVESNGGQAVYDLNENNILAKKSDFADAIKNDIITISQESWNNFRHIFEKINTIINL